ncbi:nSTAND1 domain-containing NTPase [Streptomyces scopuliridis]
MSEDEPPELDPPDGTHEGVHLEANASEGATAIVAGRDVYITYAYGVRHRRRAESRGPVPKCPYPGLAAFEQRHAQWFFGRDELVSELTTRLDQLLRTGGMRMVVAPSGAGKTSLLRAGLLPASATEPGGGGPPAEGGAHAHRRAAGRAGHRDRGADRRHGGRDSR